MPALDVTTRLNKPFIKLMQEHAMVTLIDMR